MRIQIRGKNSKISRDEYKFALKWMLSLVVSKKLLNNLHVILEFLEERGLKGSTECVDSEYRPRHFRIRIDPNLTRTAQLKTLAHELVHVKQFAMCEMRYTKYREWIKWYKQSIHSEETDYWDLPWEIEAFGREYGIYIRYVEHTSKNKIKFWSNERKNYRKTKKN